MDWDLFLRMRVCVRVVRMCVCVDVCGVYAGGVSVGHERQPTVGVLASASRVVHQHL